MASNGNQPKQSDQSKNPQQSDPSRNRGQDQNTGNKDNNKGNTGSDRPNPADQQGDRSRKDSRTANNPDVTIPNPKNPSYGDNEPGDPRRLEIDANNPPSSNAPSSGKQTPRRS